MNIIVTGGAGFIGSHLVDRLIEQGHQVVVVDDLSTGRKENLNPQAKFYQLDILNPGLSEIFKKEKPEIVFHLAAQINVRKSVAEPIEDAEINILGSINLLENCKKFGIKKIIFTSTGGAIYGEANIVPTPEEYPLLLLSPYAIAKFTTEQYLNYYYQVFDLPFVSLRLANVYGPKQNPEGEAGVIAIFIDKLLKEKKPIIFGTGVQTRDFIYVDDVVDVALKALNCVDSQAIYNVGTGKETKISDLYQLILKEIGKEVIPIFEPTNSADLQRSCLDCSRIKKELDWQSKYNLNSGLKKTINWFKYTGI